MVHILGGTERDGVRVHGATKNGAQFKTQIVYLWNSAFNICRPQVTKIVDNTKCGHGGKCVLHSSCNFKLFFLTFNSPTATEML